jgi:hypothetical protein
MKTTRRLVARAIDKSRLVSVVIMMVSRFSPELCRNAILAPLAGPRLGEGACLGDPRTGRATTIAIETFAQAATGRYPAAAESRGEDP